MHRLTAIFLILWVFGRHDNRAWALYKTTEIYVSLPVLQIVTRRLAKIF